MLLERLLVNLLGKDLVIAAMDFTFIGGSMGSVVGEKIARAIDYSIENKIPFLMISKSGGARMQGSFIVFNAIGKNISKISAISGS